MHEGARLTHRTARTITIGAAVTAGTLAVVAAMAFVFAWPWLRLNPSISDLDRYTPIRDGAATLVVNEDAAGKPLTWKSMNLYVLPPQRAVTTNLRLAFRLELIKFYSAHLGHSVDSDELPGLLSQDGTILYETRSREMDPAGVVSETVSVVLRDRSGEYAFGFYDATHNADYVYDPPIYTPPDLPVGSAWLVAGKLAGRLDFTAQFHVLDRGTGLAGAVSGGDCIELQSTSMITASGRLVSTSLTRGRFCAGEGLVSSDQLNPADPNGKPLVRTLRILAGSSAQSNLPAPPALSAAAAQPAPAPAYQSNWQMVRFGQVLLSTEPGQSTIPPTRIPTDPPLVLAAANNGDLVAFNAANATAAMVWRFHTGGNLYGPPAFDAARGVLYFGASDRRLYALSTRGLFLWSFTAGDNVATQPVLAGPAGDLVIFGSEDGNIYAVDAHGGTLRWKSATHGAVVSSPALDASGGTVIIGSDDGTVYALDPANGHIRWTFSTSGAIEAPVVISQTPGTTNSTAYIASRDGSLYALDAATGALRWNTQHGDVLRTAPVLSADRVYLVDSSGRLLTFDRQTGRLVWASHSNKQYSGRPIPLGNDVLVADAYGQVDLLNTNGSRRAMWSTGGEGFIFGPVAGGGDVWLSDAAATLWRLGAPEAAVQPLSQVWSHNLLYDAPFSRAPLYVPPAAYGERLALVDNGGVIYLLDPLSGSTMRLGSVPAARGGPFVAPVVSGNTLLTQAGNALYATSLHDGRLLWSFDTGPGVFHAPATSTDTVAVLAWDSEDANSLTATLSVLDLASGALRWQAPITYPLGYKSGGGAVLGKDQVYLSTPPSAFNLATGRLVWQVQGITPLGGPGLSAGGRTLYVGYPASVNTGGIAAIDTSSGQVRWQANLGNDYLSIFEQPWTDGGRVIIPSAGDTHGVIALDAQSGRILWRYQPPVERYGAITVSNGRVWLIEVNGQVIGLDEQTGKLALIFNQLALDLQAVNSFTQRPFVTADGRRVVAALDNQLIGLAPEGTAP